jgi:hypothetical protein
LLFTFSGGLWVTNGTLAGSQELTGTASGSSGLTPFGSNILFNAVGLSGNGDIWTTDGTLSGTTELNLSSGLNIGAFTVFGNKILFVGYSVGSSVGNLWVSDGTAAGTSEIDVSGASPYGLDPGGFTPVGSSVLFTGTDQSGNLSLWSTDGTAFGTHEIEEIKPFQGNFNLGVQNLTSIPASSVASRPPQITGQSIINKKINQSFDFAPLLAATDLGGSIVSYTFSDPPGGVGYLTQNGVPISGTSVTVSSDQLTTIGFSTGSSAGTSQIVVSATDDRGLSSANLTIAVAVSALSGTDLPPTVSGPSALTGC